MAFMVRKLEEAGQSIGEKLRALRRDRALTIEQAAEETRLSLSVLKALEENDFSRLPDKVYTRHFLKTYVRFLHGDESYFLNCYEDECGTCGFTDPLLAPRKKLKRARFLVTPRIFKFLGLALAACLVLAYLGFEVHSLMTPPTIEIMSPNDGFATHDAIIKVSGRVFEPAEVRVDGELILLNKDGTFTAEVDLRRGLNLITIEAKKRYSNTSAIYCRVVLE